MQPPERVSVFQMSNRGDNIKMNFKEMGCDDVDYITWLMVSDS